MKKSLIILTILGITIAPAFANVPKTMNKLMGSWFGENINDVINVWGKPSSQKEITGGMMYYWTSGNQPLSTNNYSGKPQGVIVTCNRVFTTAKDGRIVDWQWDGNNCFRKNSDIKTLVNPKAND